MCTKRLGYSSSLCCQQEHVNKLTKTCEKLILFICLKFYSCMACSAAYPYLFINILPYILGDTRHYQHRSDKLAEPGGLIQ
jgi:hypothetical protein